MEQVVVWQIFDRLRVLESLCRGCQDLSRLLISWIDKPVIREISGIE
ncbi:hypothetical protein [Rickettsia endosymbiont of Culicoides newsteadi]|nr:hypothetical protein [Rickettsia endosymbiont of Culicoides newsteadi]